MEPDYTNLTDDELRSALSVRGLTTEGTTEGLVARLELSDAEGYQAPAPTEGGDGTEGSTSEPQPEPTPEPTPGAPAASGASEGGGVSTTQPTEPPKQADPDAQAPAPESTFQDRVDGLREGEGLEPAESVTPEATDKPQTIGTMAGGTPYVNDLPKQMQPENQVEGNRHVTNERGVTITDEETTEDGETQPTDY